MSPFLSRRFLTLPLFALLALAVFAGCGSSSVASDDSNTPTATAANATVAATNTTGSTENQVNVSNFQFSPSTLTVKVGTTVTWKGVGGSHRDE